MHTVNGHPIPPLAPTGARQTYHQAHDHPLRLLVAVTLLGASPDTRDARLSSSTTCRNRRADCGTLLGAVADLGCGEGERRAMFHDLDACPCHTGQFRAS